MSKVKVSVAFFVLVLVFAALQFVDGVSVAKIGCIYLLWFLTYIFRACSGASSLQDLALWVKGKKLFILHVLLAAIVFGSVLFLSNGMNFSLSERIAAYIFVLAFYATSWVVADWMVSRNR